MSDNFGCQACGEGGRRSRNSTSCKTSLGVAGAGIDDADARAPQLARGDLMTPIAKAFSSEIGQDVTSLGIQLHGGMGYVEETGASQHLRDARITTIYEGTTGIQANDLIGRKLAREGGRTLKALLGRIDGDARRLAEMPDAALARIGRVLAASAHALGEAADWLLAHDDQPAQCAAGTPRLRPPAASGSSLNWPMPTMTLH